MKKIPVYVPYLTGNELKYVTECIETNWISSHGKFVEQFERSVAQRAGVAHGIACCNGTAAVHVALGALEIGRGDEVIVPTFTYIASVNPILLTGATPVFIDADPADWNQAVDVVEAAITPKTKAIMAVHLYGAIGDVRALRELADRHGVALIEDAAEAFGSTRDGRHAGSVGHISTFSFYANKTITTGEGGIVLTDDPDLEQRARKFRGQGVSAPGSYYHDCLGFNYRMTNIQAAIGVAQLEHLDDTLARKKRLASWYAEELASTSLEMQPELPGVDHSRWMIACLAPDAGTLAQLREELANEGVETRPLFAPIHRMPMYADPSTHDSFPIAADLASRGLNLPSWPGLTREDVARIGAVVRRVAPAGEGGAATVHVRPVAAEAVE
jgi:perosamine synthetase